MPSSDPDVLWCEVCEDHFTENRVDMLSHLQEDHTLRERLDALFSPGQRPEVNVNAD